MSIMSNTSTTHGDEGMDLKLNSDRPPTSSQMHTIFDPLFSSFEGKLKLEDNIPSSSDVDMNIPQARDPVPSMRKTISFKQNLDRLDGLTDFISNAPSGVNEAPRVSRERERLCPGDQSRSSGLGSEVNGASSSSVNAETHSQTLPFIVPDLGDFNSGTYDGSALPHERRHKRMVRNRGAPARSTARRLGRLENCLVKKQRLDELD